MAIISTPRSGNTWLRHLLSRLYQAATIPFHSPFEIEWNKLPVDCILQLHWHPESSFLAHLENGGFRVVVLSRHPLDVLISILHFALTDQTCRWLEGEGGNERPIFGTMPRSTAFTDYATGPRAKALLAISHEWWSIAGCHTLHYENLVAQTVTELTKLAIALQADPVVPIESAMEATTLPKLRQTDAKQQSLLAGSVKPLEKAIHQCGSEGYCYDPFGGFRQARLRLRSQSRPDW